MGEEERFRPVDLSGKVLAWLLLPKESFQVPVFIRFKIFWQGGTKSIITCRLALGMECLVVTSGSQSYGVGILVCSGEPNI